MRFISPKLHGILDYCMGILLILLPYAIGIDSYSTAGLLLIGLGIFMLIMAIFTRYEPGVLQLIPLPVHLAIDIITGIFVTMSPWIFGFTNVHYGLFLAIGLFEITATTLTYAKPDVTTTV